MNTDTHKQYRFAGHTLDACCGKLFSPDHQPVQLSSRALAVLEMLVERRGEVVSKSAMMAQVWPGIVVEENNLSQAISSIRKALGDSRAGHHIIQTVSGRGYRFIAQVEEITGFSEIAAAEAEEQQQPAGSMAENRPGAGYMRVAAVPAAIVLCVVLLSLVIAEKPGAETAAIPKSGSAALLSSASEPADAERPVIRNSIAVLPFTALTAAPDSELFVSGLHDELINQLARLNSLNVISRNSILALESQDLSLKELSRLLGVQSIITGNVSTFGDNARVSLQMLDPETGITLWASTYETGTDSLAGLFSIQSDIAMNVAMTLDSEINQQEKLALRALPTDSFAAYRYNLAAKNVYATLDYEKAWALSKEAIALDPQYYDALFIHASVNAILVGMPEIGMTSQQHYRLAMEITERMIQLQPNSPEGYILKASVHSSSREWGKAAEEIKRVRELGTPLADMRFLVSVLLSLGDFEAATDILEANLRTEPINLYARGFLLVAHELTGNRLHSRQEYELGEELTSVWWGDSANIFLALGRNEPLQDIDQIQRISEKLRTSLRNMNEGRLDLVRADLRQYTGSETRKPSESLYYSAIAAHLDEKELALVLMKDALESAWLSFYWLWLPVFDEVRQQEGFIALLQESGMPDYWDRHGWPVMCQPQDSTISCNWSAYP